MGRPITTLFMLSPADGKISTGSNDALDFERDLPKVGVLKLFDCAALEDSYIRLRYEVVG